MEQWWRVPTESAMIRVDRWVWRSVIMVLSSFDGRYDRTANLQVQRRKERHAIYLRACDNRNEAAEGLFPTALHPKPMNHDIDLRRTTPTFRYVFALFDNPALEYPRTKLQYPS